MGSLCQIWRYPIKSIGRERLKDASLVQDHVITGDRRWGLLNQKSKIEPSAPEWGKKANFITGVIFPNLQAIEFERIGQKFCLKHPKHGEVTFDPYNEGVALIDWITPFLGDSALKPTALVALDRGFSDQQNEFVAINSLSSLSDLEKRADANLGVNRWRGNLWIDGFPAWEEMDWLGKTIRIGNAELKIIKTIERCRMPDANPKNGERDFDILKFLSIEYQHKDFGVFAKVSKGGPICENDAVELLS